MEILNEKKYLKFEGGIRKYLESRKYNREYLLRYESVFLGSYLEFQSSFDYSRFEHMSANDIEKKEFSFILKKILWKIGDRRKKRSEKNMESIYEMNHLNEFITQLNESKLLTEEMDLKTLFNITPPTNYDYVTGVIRELIDYLQEIDDHSKRKRIGEKYLEYEMNNLRRGLWGFKVAIPEDLFIPLIEKQVIFEMIIHDFRTPQNEPKSVSKILKWQSL